MLPANTAADLLAIPQLGLPWVVPGLVAVGALTFIDGAPKIAGKTTFLLALLRAVLTGSTFLGRACARSSVFLLTEEPRLALVSSLVRAGIRTDDLLIASHLDVAELTWPQLIDRAIVQCHEIGAAVLAVDTVGQFCGESEGTGPRVREALLPLRRATSAGIAVIGTRHERKISGDVGLSARGSSAASGVADVVMTLRAPSDYGGRGRYLRSKSRLGAGIHTSVVLDGAGVYQDVGDVDFRSVEIEEKLLAATPVDMEVAATIEELLAITHLKKTTGREALDRLSASMKLHKIGEGNKRSPYRYYRAK